MLQASIFFFFFIQDIVNHDFIQILETSPQFYSLHKLNIWIWLCFQLTNFKTAKWIKDDDPCNEEFPAE